MARRRDFFRSLAALAAPREFPRGVGARHAAPLAIPGVTGGPSDRAYWLDVLKRLAEPVLTNLAVGRLRQRMPVEIAPAGKPERSDYTHLEAVGRLFTGIAPWLELGGDASPEGELRRQYAELARRGPPPAAHPPPPPYPHLPRGPPPPLAAAVLA